MIPLYIFRVGHLSIHRITTDLIRWSCLILIALCHEEVMAKIIGEAPFNGTDHWVPKKSMSFTPSGSNLGDGKASRMFSMFFF